VSGFLFLCFWSALRIGEFSPFLCSRIFSGLSVTCSCRRRARIYPTTYSSRQLLPADFYLKCICYYSCQSWLSRGTWNIHERKALFNRTVDQKGKCSASIIAGPSSTHRYGSHGNFVPSKVSLFGFQLGNLERGQ
jgi:hypothetical protein